MKNEFSATMENDAWLLGTSLVLRKGDKVRVSKATNTSRPNEFFARPLRHMWHNIGYASGSILIRKDEFKRNKKKENLI